MVGAGNKIPREVAIFSRYFKSLFDAKLHQAVDLRNLYQPSTFFQKSWLTFYCGVVTVTELDFGPRTVLTTAAIA